MTVSGATLRYRTVEFDRPRQLVARAGSDTLVSTDRVTVESDADGTLVTYDADLRLTHVLAAPDPLLRLALRRISDRAAAGLRRVLAGQEVV